MEISNKTLGIACASIILFGISMRVQSGSVNEPVQTTANLGNMQPKPIPDSNFNTLARYNTISQTPIDSKLGGTPNQDLINLNQAGAIVPGVTKVQDDSKPIVVVPPADTSNTSDQDVADAYSQGAADAQNGYPFAFTGNPMVDTTVGSLDTDDQAGFGMMWSTMNQSQRDKLMDQLKPH
jgi:hypothetical protein